MVIVWAQAKAGLIYAFRLWEDRIAMNIALRVVAGPIKDKVFPLDKAMSIGRQGDITLEDAKASGVHAQIDQGPNGEWILRDNDSKNGVRVGDDRISVVTLRPGLIFHIGDHSFEVILKDPPPAQKPEPVMTPAATMPAPPKTKKRQQKYWYEVLADFLKANEKAFKDKTQPLMPLEPAVVLEFARGLQMNSKWVLGYGPRKVGAGTIDLPIWEPGAPEVCFEITPTSDGILFKTDHPNVVRLNNQPVDSRILRMGDTISIQDTLIEVDFTE